MVDLDIKVRENLPFLLNKLGLNGNGAEIGVQRGDFSRHLLEHWNGKKLFLIDFWRHDESYQDIGNGDHNVQLDCMAHTFMKVYPYKERAVIIRELSVPAANLIQDGSLDFVYLDADHSYMAAKADIAAWAPKVKKGGVLSGHDYLNSSFEENKIADFGVKRAVDEWAIIQNQKIHSTQEKGPASPNWETGSPSWWTIII